MRKSIKDRRMRLLKRTINIVLLVILLLKTTCIGFSGGEATSKITKSIERENQEGKVAIERICEEWKTDNIDEKYVSKEYFINANLENTDYKIRLINAPNIGIKVTDGNSVELSEFVRGENFKVLIPIEAIDKQTQDITFKICAITSLKTQEEQWVQKEGLLEEIYIIDDKQKVTKDEDEKIEEKLPDEEIKNEELKYDNKDEKGNNEIDKIGTEMIKTDKIEVNGIKLNVKKIKSKIGSQSKKNEEKEQSVN